MHMAGMHSASSFRDLMAATTAFPFFSVGGFNVLYGTYRRTPASHPPVFLTPVLPFRLLLSAFVGVRSGWLFTPPFVLICAFRYSLTPLVWTSISDFGESRLLLVSDSSLCNSCFPKLDILSTGNLLWYSASLSASQCMPHSMLVCLVWTGSLRLLVRTSAALRLVSQYSTMIVPLSNYSLI